MGVGGQIDAGNVRCCQARQLARVTDAIAVGIDPQQQAVKIHIQCIDLAVCVAVHFSQSMPAVFCQRPVRQLRVITKQFRARVDVTIAIQIDGAK